MKKSLISLALALISSVCAEDKPVVDPEALAAVNRACAVLSSARQFAVSAEITQDVEIAPGTVVQRSKTACIRVRRPDRFQVDVRTIEPKRSIFYNGRTLSVLDHLTGYYGVAEVPPTIDAALAVMEDKFGISLPISDILLAKPFGEGPEKAKSALDLGLDAVGGQNCRHFAFRCELIDWQVWLTESSVPTIRKVAVVFKTEENAPRWTAVFSKWDFAPHLPDPVFELAPPAGSTKIEVVPTEADPKN